jgi:alanine dehydrogenase
LVETREEAFQGDLVVKVKEPISSEYGFLRKGQTLFTYLHLAASRELTDALLKCGATAIAHETVTRNQRLPLLEPMSEIAGRRSVIVGGHFLAKPHGGKGGLLGGVPKIRRAHGRRECGRRPGRLPGRRGGAWIAVCGVQNLSRN